MNGCTIALTGGTGFVGGHVLSAALKRGHRVRALARRRQEPRRGVDWITGSLDDGVALAQLLDGADAVLHVAGVVNAPDRKSFMHGNAEGTLRLVEAAKAASPARFIHVSSLVARYPALSNYGASKARAETIVSASGLDWTIVRPPGVYGPGDADMLGLFKAARWHVVPLPPGDGRLSLIHVGDLAEALLALLPVREETTAAMFEVDDGKDGGWRQSAFARAIGKAVGRKVKPLPLSERALRFGVMADGLARGKNARLTEDRARYFLHEDWTIDPALRPPPAIWRPAIDTERGLEETADWYRHNDWL